MARTYRRDARGRFASGGYSGQTGGRGARLTASGTRKGGGARVKAAGVGGTVGKPRGLKPGAMSNIRLTGGLKRPAPRSKIVSTSRRATGKAPIGLRANAVRAFNPKTPKLQRGQAERQIDRLIGVSRKEMQGIRDKAAGIKKRSNALMRKMEQRQARAFAQRNQKGVTGDIARSAIRYGGGNLNRAAQRVIQGRMQRAAAAAARGSKPASRARSIYANQLAYTGKGKPASGRNNLRPGPRNTQGPPKRKRKPRR